MDMVRSKDDHRLKVGVVKRLASCTKMTMVAVFMVAFMVAVCMVVCS